MPYSSPLFPLQKWRRVLLESSPWPLVNVHALTKPFAWVLWVQALHLAQDGLHACHLWGLGPVDVQSCPQLTADMEILLPHVSWRAIAVFGLKNHWVPLRISFGGSVESCSIFRGGFDEPMALQFRNYQLTGSSLHGHAWHLHVIACWLHASALCPWTSGKYFGVIECNKNKLNSAKI